MRDERFNRRKRMLFFLSARHKPSVVFKAVAEEFHVPVETVRRDYYNMKSWLHVVQQEEQATALAIEGMDIAVRQATDLLLGIQPLRPGAMLTIKQCFVKVQAINVYLKAICEDTRFKQSIGQIVRKPEEIITHEVCGDMPFECDPGIRQAVLDEAERLRNEKAKADEAIKAREAADGSDAPQNPSK